MRGLLSIAILACVLGTGAVRADEVVLRSGGKLSCEVIEVTDELVTVRLARGIMEIPRAKVKEIRRESKQRYLEREARRSTRSGSTATALELSERAWREARGDESVRRRLVDALEAHARALVKQFRYRDAEFTLRKLKRHAPGHRAVAELTRAMEQGNARARELLDGAQAALQNGRLEEAIRILEAWRLRRPPDDAEARATMARAYLLAGRNAASETRLRAALDHYRAASAFGSSSDARRPLYLLTPIAVLESIREGDLAGARRELRGIATTYPHPATPVFLRAVLSHVSGDVTGAVRGYTEAARLAERKVARPSGVSYDLAKRYASATLRAAIARPPSEGVSRWREVFLGSLSRYDSGKYFVVYAPTPAAAEETARAADAVYARIARDLLGRIPTAPRAEIVLHPTRQAYVAADPAPPGSPIRDAAVPREKTAGLCYDTLDEKGQAARPRRVRSSRATGSRARCRMNSSTWCNAAGCPRSAAASGSTRGLRCSTKTTTVAATAPRSGARSRRAASRFRNCWRCVRSRPTVSASSTRKRTRSRRSCATRATPDSGPASSPSLARRICRRLCAVSTRSRISRLSNGAGCSSARVT